MKPSIWKYLLVLLFPAFIAGCATTADILSRHETKLASQIAVIQLITTAKDPKEMAARINRSAENFKSIVNGTVEISFKEFDNKLTEELGKSDIAPAARPLVAELIVDIEDELKAKLNLANIDSVTPMTDAQKAIVIQYLGYIEDAVKMSGY